MAENKKAAQDVEVLALLYGPKPGSGLPPLKIVRALSRDPISPRALFERGDPGALAKLLRSDAPLTAEVRAFVAGVVDGSVTRPRGNKRMRGLSPRDVSMMRELALRAKEKGIASKAVVHALAEFYKRSEGNIRDVLDRRGVYAEK
jgi:hypothetical protein